MKRLLAFLLIIVTLSCQAQSPFKSLPKHGKYGGVMGQPSAPTSITAFRFTGPMAGYLYPQDQVVTGIGYGWQKLHWVEATQKYYTDISISGVLYAGGNVQPSIQEHNIMSVGVSLGFLNQLFMVGPTYNFAKNGSPGTWGVVANFSVPLNN